MKFNRMLGYSISKLRQIIVQTAAQCKSAIKEFGFCSLTTTFKPIQGNGQGKIIETL
jgi:hypothetical protein